MTIFDIVLLQAVGHGIISLADLSEPLQNGSHYPFFLLCLQQLHKVKDKEWLVKAFTESKIELLTMLPGMYNVFDGYRNSIYPFFCCKEVLFSVKL